MILFKDLPDTTTPLNATNLNNNFDELDNKIIESKNDIIACAPPSDFNSTAGQYKTVTLDQLYKNGNGLTISNNSIKIGNNINYIQVDARLGGYCSGSDQLYFYLQKNGSNIGYTWTVQKFQATSYYSIPLIAFIPVESGDEISLTMYSTNSQRLESNKTTIVVNGIK